MPLLACEEIVVSKDAEVGDAGRDETFIDPTIRRGYTEIAERRRTVPVAVVLAMLDKQLSAYKVQTTDGVRYVGEDELKELQQKSAVSSVETVSRAGDFAKFRGHDLRLKYGFVSHLAEDRRQLAGVLNVPASALDPDPFGDGKWIAVRVDLRGPIHAQQTRWIEKNLKARLGGGETNFVCIVIDSPGGESTDAWQLAQFLASEELSKVRTVAFVEREARGSAALVALACNQLVVGNDAVLGGDSNDVSSERDREALVASMKDVWPKSGRDWSVPAAMLDPKLVVHRYTRQGTGESRVWCAEELASQEDPDAWTRGAAVDFSAGLNQQTALELKLANHVANQLDEVATLYHVEGPMELMQPNWAHLLIEKLASPRIAFLLLFVAWFALMVEISQPGVGVPGFVSAVCFVLYFWSQFLHGTAGWLEVILFITGVVSVLVEIFVVPGAIVFGFGGGALIITSLVLASQTFVIPRNAYQMSQLPVSLMTVAATGAGAFLALVLVRKHLPNAPLLKRLMLPPPDEEDLQELDARETLIELAHLVGKRGKTLTPLMPSGKASFGDEIISVASDGKPIDEGMDVIAVADRGNYLQVEEAGRYSASGHE